MRDLLQNEKVFFLKQGHLESKYIFKSKDILFYKDILQSEDFKKITKTTWLSIEKGSLMQKYVTMKP